MVDQAPESGELTPAEIAKINRRVAAHAIGRIESAEALGNSQLVTTSNWLNASLLAINGAGALATLNAAPQLNNPQGPATFFGLGVLLTLLSAVAIQSIMYRSTTPLALFMEYWRAVEIFGDRNMDEEARLRSGVTGINRWRTVPPTIGWASGVCFVVGAAWLGLGLATPNKPDPRVCAWMEHDMVLSKPKRSDSRELFEALKCRP